MIVNLQTVMGVLLRPFMSLIVDRPDAIDVPARSREEIEMVFDQNKGATYALYNCACAATRHCRERWSCV